MNSDGSGLTKLTDDQAEDTYPTWRPGLRDPLFTNFVEDEFSEVR